MNKNGARLFVDGKEVGFRDTKLKIDKTEDVSKFQFGKTYEGTLSNVEFSSEFLDYIEKQRKLMKMQKARKNLYKYMD